MCNGDLAFLSKGRLSTLEIGWYASFFQKQWDLMRKANRQRGTPRERVPACQTWCYEADEPRWQSTSHGEDVVIAL